jgi:hypothetical protein
MAATAHLPERQPTDEQELPYGRKNWDKPPQQVSGDEGPEPHPTPKEAGAGDLDTNSQKRPQQVKGPEGPEEPWPPSNVVDVNSDPRPQSIPGPQGPDPTDGSEVTKAATSLDIDKDGAHPHKAASKAAAKKAPAKKAAASSARSKGK